MMIESAVIREFSLLHPFFAAAGATFVVIGFIGFIGIGRRGAARQEAGAATTREVRS